MNSGSCSRRAWCRSRLGRSASHPAAPSSPTRWRSRFCERGARVATLKGMRLFSLAILIVLPLSIAACDEEALAPEPEPDAAAIVPADLGSRDGGLATDMADMASTGGCGDGDTGLSCGGQCVNPLNDPAHCGNCETACKAG